MSFEWRTDEDVSWEESAKREESAASPSFWQRRWRFLLVALLGIVGVWAVVQWQINQRVAAAAGEIEAELLKTHNLVLQTAVSQDELLFRSNLSGRDPAWSQVQRTLLNEGLLLDRPMLGWQHEAMPEPLTLKEVNIELDATFRAAELVYPQTYVVQLTSGMTQTVTLQQTAVYRRGAERWIYTFPLDEFWGNWTAQGGEHLTLAYTERDQAVATRLAADLDALLDRLCAELNDLTCDDLYVRLRLDTNPQSLLAIKELETLLDAGLQFELPTPTLIGLPTDEASYDVLYRAYGVALATAVLAHQTEYDCCQRQLFFRALRDYQVAELGLQAWPLQEAMFSQALAEGFNGSVLNHWARRQQEVPSQFIQEALLEQPDPGWQHVYMLVEYLGEQDTAVSLTDMMRRLNQTSFDDWVKDVLAGGFDQERFATLFLDYIYAQSRSGRQAQPPIPLPAGEIALICNDYQSGSNSRVYAYDLNANNWVEKFTHLDLPANGSFYTLDGEHFIVRDVFDRSDIAFYFVTEESKLLLKDAPATDNAYRHVNYYFWDISANYILREAYGQSSREWALRSLDCPTDGCPEIQLTGFPTFSPNGRFFIERAQPEHVIRHSLQTPAELQYELFVVSVDSALRQSIGRGGHGFWLNDHTYGFVRIAEDGWELVTATLAQPQPRVLLREADLLAEVPAANGQSARFTYDIASATVAGLNGLVLQVVVGNEPGRQNHLFWVQLADDLTTVADIDLLWAGLAGGVGYSPDGRYIVLAKYNYASNNGAVPHYMLDLETRQISKPFIIHGWYGMSWSPDGQWFVQYTPHYVLLHAPAHDYQYYIPHSLEGCQQAVLSVDE